LDRETEKFTIDLLRQLKNEMAVFYISHRLHVLNGLADRIYILENGTIKSFGSHTELMEGENFYSDYFSNVD